MGQVTDLRAIAEAATPGPWSVGYHDGSGLSSIVAGGQDDVIGTAVVMGGSPEGDIEFGVGQPSDAAHIAAWSPDRAIAALDVIEAARTLLVGSGDEVLSDEEWDPVFLALRDALARWDVLEAQGSAHANDR